MTRYELAVSLAEECGGIVFDKFDTAFGAAEKTAGDYVTEADLQSEKHAIDTIRRLFPGDGILSEETGVSAKGTTPYTWIIDPLDGTNNFVRHIPIFCSSVAVCENGRPAAGAVYDPVRRELFHGERGRGAFLGEEPLRVSERSVTEELICYLSLVPGRTGREEFDRMTKKIRLAPVSFRRLGSAALAHAYVAAGRIDAALSDGLHSWDLAAGCLLIEEAGGRISGFAGNEADMNDTVHRIIAGSPYGAAFLKNSLETADETMV